MTSLSATSFGGWRGGSELNTAERKSLENSENWQRLFISAARAGSAPLPWCTALPEPERNCWGHLVFAALCCSQDFPEFVHYFRSRKGTEHSLCTCAKGVHSPDHTALAGRAVPWPQQWGYHPTGASCSVPAAVGRSEVFAMLVMHLDAKSVFWLGLVCRWREVHWEFPDRLRALTV